MTDVKKILNKNKWTGRELGILELTNTAVMFKQALEGKEKQEPVVDEAQLKKMVRGLGDKREGKVYNLYIEVHRWLTVQYNIAQTQYQQAQLQLATLLDVITEATLLENTYNYREKLPCVMTQKQYDALKEKRLEDFFTDEDGKDSYSDAFSLIYDMISTSCERLKTEPDKPNYLKAIRTKYKKKSVESQRIYEAWNDCTGKGYWTLEDGRRSDEMTDEEWDEALIQGGADLWEQADIIFNSKTPEEVDEKLQKATFAKTEWHASQDLPEDIKKWEVIEDPLLLSELFCFTMEEPDALEEFRAEFPELTEATLKEIDKALGTEYSSTPVGKWKPVKDRELYQKDFCGTKEWVESDRYVFEGNLRALLNGVAILTEESLKFHNTVDEDGNYKEPVLEETRLSPYSLQSFFMEAETYASSTATLTRSRNTLLDSYYYLMGYNYSIEKIAEIHEVPDFEVFKQDLTLLEANMDAFTDFVTLLYQQVKRTDYGDKLLQTRKLQVLRDYFYPVNYKELSIPEENKEKADHMIAEFTAFEPKHADRFSRLLFERPSFLGVKKDEEDSQ